MDAIVAIHGSLRWAVAIALLTTMVLATVAAIWGQWYQALKWTNRSVMILLTVQFVLGAVLLVHRGIQVGWDVPGMRLQYEHAITMLIAVALSHLLLRVEHTGKAHYRARRILAISTAVVLLVAIGVIRLRGVGYWMPF